MSIATRAAIGALVALLAVPAAAGQAHGRRVKNTRTGAPTIVRLVDSYASRHGIPRAIAHGVVAVESGYRCHVRASDGKSAGLMQVRPETARSVGVHGSMYDCRTSLEAGMRYLRLALDRGGRGCAGVSLYNRGIFARPSCTEYGRRVMAAAS